WFDSLADYRERLYDSPEGERIIARDVAGFMGGADAYVVAEQVQRAPGDPPAIGRGSAGKLFACLLRARETTREAFVAHWLARHAPLALRHHATTRYVINPVEQRLGTGPEYDGFAELQFASASDLRDRLYLSAEGQKEVEADIPRFIGTTHAYEVTEYAERW